MADTDDQDVALEPDQREHADDDSPEALNERRADAWVRDAESPEKARREQELAELREEEERELYNDRVELARQDEHELQLIRRRGELLDAAKSETTEALRVAYAAEDMADRRADAGAGRLEGRRERSRGDHLLDDAATRRDEPGADATAAAGRAHHRRGNDADRRAANDDRDADSYDAVARRARSDAAQSQSPEAPAVGAVQNPPPKPPVARTNRRPVKRKKLRRDTSAEPDLGLGDR
ncbi:hypothetical protein AB0F43_19880 [Kribbella sp. NPDC023972]|uniref:hypothetical protein n=1 Tax=Kribbella sp. NPDC023972 TaxID=3154795 RepID=UPI0034113EDC